MDLAQAQVIAGLSCERAVDHIRLFRRLTISGVLGYLHLLRDRLILLHLYQFYFPQQFAESTASVHMPPGKHGHSPREREFFDLVGNHFFPCFEIDLDDDSRLPGIPVMPVGMSFDDGRDYETVYAVLAALVGVFGDAWPEVLVQWEEPLPPLDPAVPAGHYDREMFAGLCRQRGGAFRDLPLALRIVSLETGNPWLDTTDETPVEDPDWSISEIDHLRAEWAKADRMLDRLRALADWLEAHPRAMGTVIRMLNRSVPRRQRGPRVRVISSEEEGLDD